MCYCCVVILGSAVQHSPPLNLIIATCLVLRHLWTLKEADDACTELAFPNLLQAIRKLVRNGSQPKVAREEKVNLPLPTYQSVRSLGIE